MAEILGTVSASIGIAAAAGQLLDGIVKLRRFCEEIRNIPDEISNAIDDLSALSDVLELFQTRISRCTFPHTLNDGACMCIKILEILQQSSRYVSEVHEEIQSQLRRKTYWGRVKAVGMRRKLEVATSRVEKAQMLFLIALNTDNNIFIRQSYEAQRQGFNTTSCLIGKAFSIGQGSNLATREPLPVTNDQTSATVEGNPEPGDIVLSPRPRTIRSSYSHSRAATLRLPTWWWPKQVWELSFRRAIQGWDLKLQSYPIRPHSEIFASILAGDLQRVRQLLTNREASVHDRDLDGNTTLHFAAQACGRSDDALTILKLLLGSGADINALSFNGEAVHQWLLWNWNIDDCPGDERLLSAYRLFANHRDWIVPQPVLRPDMSPGALAEIVDLHDSIPEGVVHLALNQTWPPWKERTLSDQLDALFPPANVVRVVEGSPLCFRRCISREDFQSSFAFCSSSLQLTLLDWICSALSRHIFEESYEEIEVAREILEDIVSTSGFPFVTRVPSLLGIFLRARVWADRDLWHVRRVRIEDVMQKGAKSYVSEMLLAGLDMSSLIELERTSVQGVVCITVMTSTGFSLRPFRIIGLETGQRADDWYLWLSNPLDEWAGEFWDMIEHPERAMPGAWEDWVP